MSDEYTGNSSGSHPPSPTPAFNHNVKIQILEDGVDPLNSSAIHQSVLVLADWVEFLRDRLSFNHGVNTWTIDWTYAVGDMVIDTVDHRTYRCTVSNTGLIPSSNLDKWARCDYGKYEIQALAADLVNAVSGEGITCSHGASAGTATMLKLVNDLFRVIFVTIQGVPLDGSTVVDISGATTKFGLVCLGGLASMQSGGYSYGGQVGVNVNTGANSNVCTIWAKKGSGDPVTTCTVGLLLFGA